MAPFFGASTIVWANTIGVVLVALSVGYWYGGKLGDRYPSVRALCLVVMAASVLFAIVPLIAQPFFEVSVGALDEIEAGAFVGSLFAVLFLVAIPVGLAGTCSPWAIRLAVSDVESAGEVAGRLYAISTVGSLAGTMLSALVLIPRSAPRGRSSASPCCSRSSPPPGSAGASSPFPVALAAAFALPVGTVKATDSGTILYEGESEQQYIRVIENEGGERDLELNEGQAVHSTYRPGSYLTADYWDSFLVLPFTSFERPPERIAILGNAAGTIARGFGHYWPETEVDGVEIDPDLTDVGYRYFDMGSNENLTTYADDARPWLRRSAGGYEMIVVDAYRQPYIPFYMATKEFFELVRDRLAPGGIVVVNVGHPEGNDEFERVIGRTMADVFPTVLRDPAEQTNTLMLGSEAPASAERLDAARSALGADLADLARFDAARLAPPLPGGAVYTDDRAPVEWLIDRTILGYAADK